MAIPTKYKGKYFYHFTHIENLESIVTYGLLSTNMKNEFRLEHKNVASVSIQHRRSEMDVTCSPGGKVHDYVPFYFTTTNPMLLSVINHKNIDQPFIIILVVSIEKILEDSVVFTDASANTSIPPNFYNDSNNLDKLDWNAINSRKWSARGNELHKRMAEVLLYSETPLDWIDSIIVWNESFRKKVESIFNSAGLTLPNIQCEPFKNQYFYFTKFSLGRKNESLVTGPFFLKKQFNEIIKDILQQRENKNNFIFNNLEDALEKIDTDFCVIKELADIFELETENEVHPENVSDHTKKVVENLNANSYYKKLTEKDKNIVKFSAYLHDIGKGPKSKWNNGIQPAYPDHPADSLPMLKRILTEDFEELSEYEIKKICLLVAYHDLIGDVLRRGRNKQELIDLIKDEKELNMLIAISMADISAISSIWRFEINLKLPKFVREIEGIIE